MRASTCAVIAGIFALAGARQAADLPLPDKEYQSYDCDEICQKALKVAAPLDFEAVGSDFDFEFYATAHNFSTSLEPGRILKYQLLDANTREVSSGTTVYMMQYTSRDLDGSIVPVTAFVAFPQVAPDSGRFPLVAWAHGTIGIYPACAQSNGPSMYDYGTWMPLVQRGYAVVATDYAGLGNNYTTHKYNSHLAEINDIYYSVKAARDVMGDVFAEEWMSVGHSQGAGAVWKLAESDFVKDDSKYMGTVAVAPATYLADMVFDNINKPTNSLAGYFPYLPPALERAVPGFDSSFVSPVLKKRLEMAEKTQLCIAGMFSLVQGLNESQMFDPVALNNIRADMLKWQNENSAALGGHSPAPVLVVQGGNDTTVLPYVTEKAWNNSCGYGNEVHLRIYEGQEHSPTMQASAPEWLRWIDGRFSGGRKNACAQRCTQKTRKLLAGKNTSAPPETP